jgi:uncharacterized membrane protein (DUF4010 family)
MQRALLMFALYMTMIVPVLTSRDTKPSRGMKRTVYIMLVVIVVWGYSCRTFFYRFSDD